MCTDRPYAICMCSIIRSLGIIYLVNVIKYVYRRDCFQHFLVYLFNMKWTYNSFVRYTKFNDSLWALGECVYYFDCILAQEIFESEASLKDKPVKHD